MKRLLLGFVLLVSLPLAASDTVIDREALVRRHNIHYDSVACLEFSPQGGAGELHDPAAGKRYTPLQVGNGEFAFSVDVTGLQTFIPCNTMSHWGWHVAPLPKGLKAENFEWTRFKDPTGRQIPFPFVGLRQDKDYKGTQVEQSPEQKQLAEWLRANPHRLNLGRLAMEITLSSGRPCALEDLRDVSQTLDLWTGIITSHFVVDGTPVAVRTACASDKDAVAVSIRSPLLAQGRLRVRLSFPGSDSRGYTNDVGDWSSESGHLTELVARESGAVRILRTLDDQKHAVFLSAPEAEINQKKHVFVISSRMDSLDLVCEFQKNPTQVLSAVSAEAVFKDSTRAWKDFWTSGGVLDFSGSTHPRAFELEKRVVHSQYLLAVQEAGSLPPQEAGLVNNGWYGKFHMEMYPWHVAHYALWNRWPLLRRSLGVYERFTQAARELAARQGYEGLRWPKMVGPDGRQSPSSIAPFLIWQQPHPLFFAELDYRAHPSRETLQRWAAVVTGTADFMCSLPRLNPASGFLDLAYPLKTVPENAALESTRNPTFELAYWRYGLRVAIAWKKRLGETVPSVWTDTLAKLAPLPVKEGAYLLSETQPDTYENYPWEHPSLTGVFGLLPGDGVKKETSARTLDAVLSHWKMNRVWGWDFPMLAMSAARLGNPEKALNLLFTDSPNFQFAPNGFATGGPWPYFPSNGSLLYAVAFMAAGWDGAPEGNAPGFPKDGTWKLRYEGLSRAP